MSTINTLNSLLTLSEAQEYMQDSTTGNESRFTDLINVVSDLFNAETGRKLKHRIYSSTAGTSETYEYRDGNGIDTMWLYQYPIVSSATQMSIYVDTDRAYSSTSDQIASTDIMIYADEGKIVLDDDTFDAGNRSVRIKYAAGYTVTTTSSGSTRGTLPADLVYAAKEMMRFLWTREETKSVGMRQESIEGMSRTYDNDIPFTVRRILEKYRDVRYG
jgi:hypothetical protein